MASVPCVECEDVASAVRCVQCEDNFCSLCFQYLHRKGKRATHTPIKAENNEQLDMPKQEKVEGTTAHFVEKFEAEKKKKKSEKKSQNNKEPENTEISRKLLEQINFTPLRLNEEERNLLGLMEGVLNISEYTDKVDVSSSNYGYGFGFFSFGSYGTNIRNKDQIIMRELDEIFSLISGLYTSTNLRRGKTLVLNRTFKDNSAFFQQAFEIARRFKIMNPDKMRTTYGKMMHLLQDAVTPGLLDFQVKKPIKTVRTLLTEKDCYELFVQYGEYINLATESIPDNHPTKQQQKQFAKEKAFDIFVKQHKKLTEDEFECIINSLSDCNEHIALNVRPVESMIRYLEHYFKHETPQLSIAINYGRGGSKLSHSHSQQYQFVLQSLLLWREIQLNLFKLWIMADVDLLSDKNRYKLSNTGQGLNRVQAAPAISKTMHEILHSVQSRLKHWVGLSVVHLGDRDVPNALVFIDKYNQVSRILHPIATTIQTLDTLYESNADIKMLIDKRYSGIENSKICILQDFFKHGFDGSGDDGGSCIDGRLTSCWNWCSKLEKKSFYNLFMLTGFEGFDGSYRR